MTSEEVAFVARLQSDKPAVVVEAIKDMHTNGKSLYLPFLFDALAQKSNDALLTETASLLCDLRDETAIPFIINAIEDDQYQSLRYILLSGCWQSSLDFSMHLPVFVDVFIKDEFLNAFEAFTVIENVDSFPPQLIAPEIQKLKQSISDIHEDKKELFSQLVKILDASISIDIN